MRRFMLLAVSILAVASMAVSPAFAHDWDGDGWDEEGGFWTEAVEWDDGVDFDDDDFDWDDVDCVVEDVDYSGVFEEWEVELACGLE